MTDKQLAVTIKQINEAMQVARNMSEQKMIDAGIDEAHAERFLTPIAVAQNALTEMEEALLS